MQTYCTCRRAYYQGLGIMRGARPAAVTHVRRRAWRRAGVPHQRRRCPASMRTLLRLSQGGAGGANVGNARDREGRELNAHGSQAKFQESG
eukprot:17330_4